MRSNNRLCATLNCTASVTKVCSVYSTHSVPSNVVTLCAEKLNGQQRGGGSTIVCDPGLYANNDRGLTILYLAVCVTPHASCCAQTSCAAIEEAVGMRSNYATLNCTASTTKVCSVYSSLCVSFHMLPVVHRQAARRRRTFNSWRGYCADATDCKAFSCSDSSAVSWANCSTHPGPADSVSLRHKQPPDCRTADSQLLCGPSSADQRP